MLAQTGWRVGASSLRTPQPSLRLSDPMVGGFREGKTYGSRYGVECRF